MNIGYDIVDFHSPSTCLKCITNISNIKNFSSETTLNKLINSEKETVKIWIAFSDSLNEEECKLCSHYNSFNSGTKNSKRAIKTTAANVSANMFFQSPQSVLLEPNASICQNNETSDIMICDNLNSAVISNICDDTPVFAGDNSDTDIDYILQESETSCSTDAYDAHTISAQEQTSMLTNTNEQKHSSVEENNTDILMRLARALERGDSELESYSHRENPLTLLSVYNL